MSGEEKITIDLNIFDDEGNVVDGATSDLTRAQISDIIDHAAQLVLVSRGSGGVGMNVLMGVLAELEEALVVADVIAAEDADAAPKA